MSAEPPFLMKKTQKTLENLKKIGIFAREYAESLFDKQVVIHIFVKVDEDWLNKNINKYGY